MDAATHRAPPAVLRQAVDAPAALRLVRYQPGVTQHLEVLGDGRATELEPFAEFPRAQLLPGEDL